MTPTVIAQLIEAIPSLRAFHAPTDPVCGLLRMIARREVTELFASEQAVARPFEPFGELVFPYTRMGNIDSLDLFGIDELIIFAFYHANRQRYRRVLDLGANLGIHSIVMARSGFEVMAFEPDPRHFELLRRNLGLNHVSAVTPVNAAVSTHRGKMEFIRVLGNTTGSHIAGSKSNVYGGTERFPVDGVPFAEIVGDIDLVKMDVEGHEAAILTATAAPDWHRLDMMLEVGSEANARAIHDHFRDMPVRLFAQKIGWRRVVRLEDMPTSHRDGSLFITAKDEMPWG